MFIKKVTDKCFLIHSKWGSIAKLRQNFVLNDILLFRLSTKNFHVSLNSIRFISTQTVCNDKQYSNKNLTSSTNVIHQNINEQINISHNFDLKLDEVKNNALHELDRIHIQYPQPKLTLNNYYQMVCNELGNEKYKIDSQFKILPQNKKGKHQWNCIYKVLWPLEMKIHATAATKQEAAKQAAFKVIHWLKNQGKIRGNGSPVCYRKDDINLKKAPIELKISDMSSKRLTNIIKMYDNQIEPLLQKEDNNIQCSEKFETSENNDLYLVRNRKGNIKININENLNADLPIFKYRDKIVNIINENQVVVIKGEPGCGKSTQVPQYILNNMIKQNLTEKCDVIVTQPRRIAAISLAERVAFERNEHVGKTVGYQVRFHSKFNPNTGTVLYCTTGILLKRLQSDPYLLGVSHIILDEAHERDTNIDLLLLLLKNAMATNPLLKIVVMSATINAELFQQYFNNAPALNIPGFTYPVKRHYLDDININFDKTKSIEAFNNPSINTGEIANIIEWIHNSKGPGAILCFLPGWEEIVRVKQFLDNVLSRKNCFILPLHSRLSKESQMKIFNRPPPGVRKIILATNIAETSVTIDDVVYVVDTGVHKEKRLDSYKGIECIDNFWISQSNVNQRAGRAGRVQPGECYHLFSRNKYNTLEKYPLPEINRVSLVKTVLDTKLYSRNMKAVDFFQQLLSPPDSAAIRQAVEELISLGVLNTDESLTPLGRTISSFALAPKLSKALIYSYFFCCAQTMTDIVTILSADTEIFSSALTDKDFVREVKGELSNTSDHLALARLLQQWREINSEDRGSIENWSIDNGVNRQKMNLLSRLSNVHLEYLEEYNNKIKIEISDQYSNEEEIVKAVLLSGVGNILLYRNWDFAKGRYKKTSSYIKNSGQKATLTSDSINYKRKTHPTPFLVHAHQVESLIRRITLVRETSLIQPLSVLLFKNDFISVEKDASNKNENVILKQGNNIKIVCTKKDAENILKVKKILNRVTDHFILLGSTDSLNVPDEEIYLTWKDILKELNLILENENKILFNEFK